MPKFEIESFRQATMISHTDLDGYGCTGMHFASFGASDCAGKMNGIYNVNYNELKDTLEKVKKNYKGELVIITDLSIPEDCRDILSKFDRLLIVDHHKSSEWLKEAFPNDYRHEIIVDSDRCATYLYWKYISQYFLDLSEMEDWAVLIDDYDRWIHAYPDSDYLNIAFQTSQKDRSDFLFAMSRHSLFSYLNSATRRIEDFIAEREEYTEKTPIYEIASRVYLCFAERHKSYIADYIIKDRCADVVFVADLHNQGVSIRSAKDCDKDCSKIAKNINPNGGGHFHASGASLEGIHIPDLFKVFADSVRYRTPAPL